MKRITIIITIALISMVYLSSCSKEDEVIENKSTNSSVNKHKNARMNNNMTDAEMEADIKEFMQKLDNPAGQADMNFEEAFEYVEATLNFKYVNYDYSKCAQRKIFTSSVNISVDANKNMTMDDIKKAYSTILTDWKTKYHSITETVKTPIVFDITDVQEDVVKYTMIVGYGKLDLNEWGEDFVPASSTHFTVAAQEFSNQLYAHINNDMIQWMCGGGTRIYIPVVGAVWYAPNNFPTPGSIDPYPAISGYTDYRLFYTDNTFGNIHYDLNQTEYNFYYQQLGYLMTNFLNNNPNSNYISFAYVDFHAINNGSNYIMARHLFNFKYGRSYCTAYPIYTL